MLNGQQPLSRHRTESRNLQEANLPLFACIDELNTLSLILETKAVPAIVLALLFIENGCQKVGTEFAVNQSITHNLSSIIDVKCPSQFPAKVFWNQVVQVSYSS